MASLDTNTLVRYLVKDDEVQLERVKKLMRQTMLEVQTLYVPITVTLELEWVLRSVFKFDVTSIVQAFDALLQSCELSFQSEWAISSALDAYETQRNADFADCLHIALSQLANKAPLWTFDKGAAKLGGAALLQ